MSDTTQYFRKFPVVNYRGYNGINIMRRVNLTSQVRDYTSVFYDYTVTRDESIDRIAYNYYDDPDYDWIIYHANDIIDPWYDFYLTDTQFQKYIEKKYGSVEKARNKILKYRSNHAADDRILSSSGYAALDVDTKKYWTPEYNAFGLLGFVRSQEDFTLATNMIISLDLVEGSQTGTFIHGENVKRDDELVSRAEICWHDDSSMTLKHVRGDFRNLKKRLGVQQPSISVTVSDFVFSGGNVITSPTADFTVFDPEIEIEVVGTRYNDGVYVVDTVSQNTMTVRNANFIAESPETNVSIIELIATDYTITGMDSGATATVSAKTYKRETSSQNENSFQYLLRDEELVYYSELDAYTYEFELNESKRDIYLVDKTWRWELNSRIDEVLK